MDRAQKEAVVSELDQIFTVSGVVVVTHYTGLTVAEMSDLRLRMRNVGGAVRGAKNKLVKIALEGKECQSIGKLFSAIKLLKKAMHLLFEYTQQGDPKSQLLSSSSNRVSRIFSGS